MYVYYKCALVDLDSLLVLSGISSAFFRGYRERGFIWGTMLCLEDYRLGWLDSIAVYSLDTIFLRGSIE